MTRASIRPSAIHRMRRDGWGTRLSNIERSSLRWARAVCVCSRAASGASPRALGRLWWQLNSDMDGVGRSERQAVVVTYSLAVC